MIHKFLKRWKPPRRPVGYYRICIHRSHRLRLPCYRLQTWDGQCSKHNDTCFNVCPYAMPEPLDLDHAALADEAWRLTADWWDANAAPAVYDPQDDYPPPLRRPTGDSS